MECVCGWHTVCTQIPAFRLLSESWEWTNWEDRIRISDVLHKVLFGKIEETYIGNGTQSHLMCVEDGLKNFNKYWSLYVDRVKYSFYGVNNVIILEIRDRRYKFIWEIYNLNNCNVRTASVRKKTIFSIAQKPLIFIASLFMGVRLKANLYSRFSAYILPRCGSQTEELSGGVEKCVQPVLALKVAFCILSSKMTIAVGVH